MRRWWLATKRSRPSLFVSISRKQSGPGRDTLVPLHSAVVASPDWRYSSTHRRSRYICQLARTRQVFYSGSRWFSCAERNNQSRISWFALICCKPFGREDLKGSRQTLFYYTTSLIHLEYIFRRRISIDRFGNNEPPSPGHLWAFRLKEVTSTKEECRLLWCDTVWLLSEPTFGRKVSPTSSGWKESAT
jgi:hypothetical protein